jgi:L-fucose isomerase-like protein
MTAAAKPRIGFVALARPTFDVPFAEETLAAVLGTLDGLDVDLVGPRALLFDADAARAALDDLRREPLDLLLIAQVTFTDATMTVALAEAVEAPILLWSVPEDRTGGRLRLNSLCGINLAAHALGRAGKTVRWMHRAPDDPGTAEQIRAVLADPTSAVPAPAPAALPAADADGATAADRAAARLSSATLAVVGEHPAGFDTCRYDADALAALSGTRVETVALETVFAGADAVPADRVAADRAAVSAEVAGLDTMERDATDGTLRVRAALEALAADKGYAGLAVRCWPEFFTEKGCAACGAMSLMTEAGVPCGCEADLYGTLTTLALQEIAGAPAFMADLVDLDRESDTGVLWHCGLAPLSMADPETTPRATVHSNRRKPLLMEFPLKPGRITLARFSQAGNRPRLVIGGAAMVRAPLAFSGTAGTVRFDRPVDAILDTVMAEGLEHHYAFAYGEHRPALVALADRLGLQILALS